MPASFNLIEAPFIPCRTAAGTALLGLRDALGRAHEIVEVADPSPLTTFALYRFLLVVVHRALGPGDWGGDRLPMDRIDKYLGGVRDRFDLFDARRPFLQEVVGDEAKLLSVSELIAELPTATNINHARHALDATVALCPVCCAHGLLRLAPFCGQGGQGKAPSINAPPPAYFLPLGPTLFDTLRRNAAALPRVPGDAPAWEVGVPKTKEIGPLEAFTWQPRTVHLREPAPAGTPCTLCGRGDVPAVHRIVFQKGRDRSDPRVRAWRDPHAAYATETRGRVEVVRTLVPPEVIQRTDAAAGFWRQTAAVVLRGEPFRCAAVDSPGCADGCVRVVALHTRQAKVLHDHAEDWILPPLTDADRAELLEHLDWLRDGLAGVGDALRARDEFERRAEGLFRRRLAGGSADDFRRDVLHLVTGLTRPGADPHRPLTVHAARRKAETAARDAFPIPEVTP